MIKEAKELLQESLKKLRAQHPNIEIFTPPKWTKLANMVAGSEISFDIPDGAKYFRISASAFVFFSPVQKAVYPSVAGTSEIGDTQLCPIYPREIQALTTEKGMFYISNPQAVAVHVMVEFWGADL